MTSAQPAEKGTTRFLVLDGLRGLAACFVLTRHTEGFWPFPLYRSYLAVDLFFLMSGFVIAYAYDERLARGLQGTRFLLIRWIRLFPMYVVGWGIAAALLAYHTLRRGGAPMSAVVAAAVLGLAFLPYRLPNSKALFPINGTSWSLFFELLVNGGYAFLYRHLTNARLALTVLGALLALAVGGFAANGLDLGYNWSWLSVGGGLARATFGIGAGILLYRLRPAWQRVISPTVTPIGGLFAGTIVCAALVSPTAHALDGVIDLVLVVLVFPAALIYLSEVELGGAVGAACDWLGRASYPVYTLHLPVATLISTRAVVRAGVAWAPWSGLLFAAALVLGSIWLERALDRPARQWLLRRLTM